MNVAVAAHEPAVRDIRFGIIGCSAIAPRALLEPIGHVAGARVTALANRTVVKAGEMADRFGISVVYRHAEDLLKDPDIDAVSLHLATTCMPSGLVKHCRLTSTCWWKSRYA